MIFLGAGASKTFGIKTLQEMSLDLAKFMEEKDHSESIEKIKSSLQKYGLSVDFEAFYTIVQAMANPKEAIRKAGPFTAFVCKDSVQAISAVDCQELLRDFRAFLIQECQPKPELVVKIQSIYGQLFRALSGEIRTDLRCSLEKPLVQDPPKWVGNTETIVTTNYDMIVEQYFWSIGEPFSDGFKPSHNPNVKELDLSTYDKNQSSKWLIKLHGSIWMYKHHDSIFKTTVDPKNLPVPVNIEEEMMIFPIKEKPVFENPYYDLYNLFRRQVWSKLVIIGYSFRDEPINSAILSNLQENKKSNLILVNPNPDEVIQNFSASLPKELNNRIIRIKGLFGEPEVFRQLELTKRTENTERFDELLENL